MKGVEIHESALRKAIISRGGMENLGCIGLHVWISWYTLSGSIVTLLSR